MPRFIVRALASILIALMVVSPTGTFAQESGGSSSGGGAAAGVGGAAASILGCLTGGFLNFAAVPTHSGDDTKECLLDGIFYAIKQAFIAQITESIIDWINSGFEGSPAFITDFDAFLTDTLDKAAGEFIYGNEYLSFLCSPFQLAIRLQLATDYRSKRYVCTLSDVVNNVEGFFSGSFTNWRDWFDITTRKSNNPYGAYLSARAELNARLQNEQLREQTEAGWSGGFLSWKKCVEYGQEINVPDTPSFSYSTSPTGVHIEGVDEVVTVESIPGGTTKPCLRYETQTPGKYIADAGADALGSGFEQLKLADEFDQIVNALFAQLVRQALTSDGGLRGLSSRSSGQPSYLSLLSDQTNQTAVNAGRRRALFDIANASETETAYYNTLRKTLDRLDESEALLRDLETCYTNKGNNPSLSATEQATARQRAQQAADIIAVQIAPQQNVQITKLDQTLVTLQRFEELRDFSNTADTLEELDVVAREIELIAGSDDLHTVRDVEVAESDFRITDTALNALDQATGEKLAECEAFPQSRFF